MNVLPITTCRTFFSWNILVFSYGGWTDRVTELVSTGTKIDSLPLEVIKGLVHVKAV